MPVSEILLLLIFILPVCHIIFTLIEYLLFKKSIKSWLPQIRSLSENAQVVNFSFLYSPYSLRPIIKFIYKGKQINFFCQEDNRYFTIEVDSSGGGKANSHTLSDGLYAVSRNKLSSPDISMFKPGEKLHNILDELLKKSEEWSNEQKLKINSGKCA